MILSELFRRHFRSTETGRAETAPWRRCAQCGGSLAPTVYMGNSFTGPMYIPIQPGELCATCFTGNGTGTTE